MKMTHDRCDHHIHDGHTSYEQVVFGRRTTEGFPDVAIHNAGFKPLDRSLCDKAQFAETFGCAKVMAATISHKHITLHGETSVEWVWNLCKNFTEVQFLVRFQAPRFRRKLESVEHWLESDVGIEHDNICRAGDKDQASSFF